VEAWTVIGEAGEATGGTGPEAVLAAVDLPTVTGWVPKAEGWCRGAECIPASLLGPVASDGSPPVAAVAEGLGAALAVDEEHRIAVLGHRRPAGSGPGSSDAPDVELVGLDGERQRLFEDRDGKTLVVAFASWCGCRHDLPGWQALRDELAGQLDVVAVALDEAPEDVVPYAEVVDLPVLVDVDRRFADTYDLLNVPTVVWVDEDRRVVRRPSTEFSDDTFRDFHGVASGPHLDAVRRWVREGEPPAEDVPARGWTGALSEEQRQARVEFRLALELLRRGHRDAAVERFAAADDLAPDDLSIWRAGMKLVGEDPFGPAFLERYAEWQERHE
jgi:thiol-disulfide isomerase/thioredoxin